MEKKKTNRVRMYLMLSGLSILLIGCTQINENEENVSQLETEESRAELSSACENNMKSKEETDQDWNNIEKMDIQQEIDDYMTQFIELYSTNAMEDSDSSIHTEEFEAPLGDGGNVATVVKYLDQDNRCLRYRVDLYGETMNTCINYYLCDRFVLISKQNNYYSSWVLTSDWNDILYSEIDQWILWNDKVYIFSDNSQLEEIDKEQLEVPTIRELERY